MPSKTVQIKCLECRLTGTSSISLSVTDDLKSERKLEIFKGYRFIIMWKGAQST